MKVKRNGRYQRSSLSSKNYMDGIKTNGQREPCHIDTLNLNHVWTNKSQWHQGEWHKTIKKHNLPPVKFTSRVNDPCRSLTPLRVSCSCSSTSDNEDSFRLVNNKLNKKSSSSTSIKGLSNKTEGEEEVSSRQSYITANMSDCDRMKIKCLYSAKNSKSSMSSFSSSVSKNSEKIIKTINELMKEHKEDFIFVNARDSDPSSCILHSLDNNSNSLLQKENYLGKMHRLSTNNNKKLEVLETDEIYDASAVSKSHDRIEFSDSVGSSTVISFYINKKSTPRLSNNKVFSKTFIDQNHMLVPSITLRKLYSKGAEKREIELKTLDSGKAHTLCTEKSVEVVFRKEQHRVREKRFSLSQKMQGDSNNETEQYNIYNEPLSNENLHQVQIEKSIIIPFKMNSKSKTDLEEEVTIIKPMFISNIPTRTLNLSNSNRQKSDEINELECRSSAQIMQCKNIEMLLTSNNHELSQSQLIKNDRCNIFDFNARLDINQNYGNLYSYESDIMLNLNNNEEESCEIITNTCNLDALNTVNLQSESETSSLGILHFSNTNCSNIFCKSSSSNVEPNTRSDCKAKLYLETNIKLNSESNVEFVRGVFRLKKSFSMIQIKPYDFTYKASAKENKSRCSIVHSNHTRTYQSTNCENKEVVREPTIFVKKFISSSEDVNSTIKIIHVESDTQGLEHNIFGEFENRKDGQFFCKKEQFDVPFNTETLIPDQRIKTIQNMNINMSKEKRIFTRDVSSIYTNDLNPVTSVHLSNFTSKCSNSNINDTSLKINNVNTTLSSDVQELMNALKKLSSLSNIKKINMQTDNRAKTIVSENNNVNEFTTKDTNNPNIPNFVKVNTSADGDNEFEFTRCKSLNYKTDSNNKELHATTLNDCLSNLSPVKTFTAITTPVGNNCKSKVHQSKYNTNAKCSLKNCCPICSPAKQSPRYVLPICTVKGATPFPRNKNDPWTRVLEKVTIKQNVRHKSPPVEDHLQCTRSTSCHFSAPRHAAKRSKDLEINVKKRKEDVTITIVELHDTSSSSSTNPTENMDSSIVPSERSACSTQFPPCPSSSFNFSTSCVPRTESPRRYRKKQLIANATCMANRLLYVISESAELPRSISPFLGTKSNRFPYETVAKRFKRARFD